MAPTATSLDGSKAVGLAARDASGHLAPITLTRRSPTPPKSQQVVVVPRSVPPLASPPRRLPGTTASSPSPTNLGSTPHTVGSEGRARSRGAHEVESMCGVETPPKSSAAGRQPVLAAPLRRATLEPASPPTSLPSHVASSGTTPPPVALAPSTTVVPSRSVDVITSPMVSPSGSATSGVLTLPAPTTPTRSLCRPYVTLRASRSSRASRHGLDCSPHKLARSQHPWKQMEPRRSVHMATKSRGRTANPNTAAKEFMESVADGEHVGSLGDCVSLLLALSVVGSSLCRE